MLVLLVMCGIANAELIDRGGGLIYDTDYDITWLADANFAMTSNYDADGLMTWSQANTWADQLEYGGYDDWRLPTALNQDGTGPDGWYDDAYDHNGSEMGHLFYDELGGTAGESIYESTDPDLDLFLNIQADLYWTSTSGPYSGRHWFFAFSNGSQWGQPDSYGGYAWAVRDGDVAPVPEPATMLISKVKVKFKDEPITDEFEIKGEFTLGEDSDGIDLFNESIEASVDSFNVVIPANTLIEEKPGEYKFKFKGIIDGIEVDLKIKEIDTDTFEFKVKAKGFDLTGTTNLVNVKLLVGDDIGTADVRLTGELKFDIKHQK